MNRKWQLACAVVLLGVGVTMGRISKENPASTGERGVVQTHTSASSSDVAGGRLAVAADAPKLKVHGLDSVSSQEDAAALQKEMDGAVNAGDAFDGRSFERGLRHADPAVREAACEALLRTGHKEAIPLLLAAAERTNDAVEAKRYEEAARFLELPEAGKELQGKQDAVPPFKPRRMKITPVE